MAKAQRKAQAKLDRRIREWEQREQYARQASGGEKLVPMMNKPGSQNRNK